MIVACPGDFGGDEEFSGFARTAPSVLRNGGMSSDKDVATLRLRGTVSGPMDRP
jgi:hypothetical protein